MRELTFVAAAREGLAEEMARDPRVIVMGEGIGARGGNFATTSGLYDLYGPERVRDTPICERGFVGMCTGAALAGARPVVDFMFVDFLLDALGDLASQTGKIQWLSDGRLKMPIVLRGCCGVFKSGGAHHSGSYYSMFAHLSGFRVVVPATPYDAKGLLKTAIRCDDPVIFLEHRELLNTKGPVPEEEYTIPLGQAAIVRQGHDATVVAIANMVPKTLAVCDQLSKEGLSIELVDPRTLAPLDLDAILESVRTTHRLLIVDQSYGTCGIGAEIAALVAERAFDDLDAPIRRLNGAQVPAPYSPVLEAAAVPSPDAIDLAIRQLLNDF